MEAHHEAWLAAHPDRSPEWFRERIRDGFDVHHLDGDHANNDRLNLVLIEHLDHLRCIHAAPGNRLVAIHKSPIGRRKPKSDVPKWRTTSQYIEERRRVANKRAARQQKIDALVLI